jgi:predicted enzyme related to lactoylglutathione lyase
MPNNPVVWFEIYVNDMPRAKKFYETVLGVRLQKLEGPTDIEMWTFPMEQEGRGAGGALAKMAGAPAGGGGTIVYFRSEDCAVEAGRVKANGGTIIKDKLSIGQYGFMALASDPDGNIIGIHSMR